MDRYTCRSLSTFSLPGVTKGVHLKPLESQGPSNAGLLHAFHPSGTLHFWRVHPFLAARAPVALPSLSRTTFPLHSFPRFLPFLTVTLLLTLVLSIAHLESLPQLF